MIMSTIEYPAFIELFGRFTETKAATGAQLDSAIALVRDRSDAKKLSALRRRFRAAGGAPADIVGVVLQR
jgi:hypothetical protein